MNPSTTMDMVETIGIPAAFAVGLGYLVWKLIQHLIADVQIG